MNAATYARRNLFRRPGRTVLTLIAIAVAVMIFNVIRTVDHAFKVGAEAAAKDRLVTRHKVSLTRQLPKHYIEDLRDPNKIKGIKAATWANWFDAKDPQKRTPFFQAFAADHLSWFDVMDEMKIEPAVLETWKQTRDGVILGDLLAKSLQVQVGGEVALESRIYPGEWKFKVIGIYQPLRKSVDRNIMVLRWDYFNDRIAADPRTADAKDEIGWVMTRIDDPTKSADITRAIDALFDERDNQTLTMSERAFQLSFIGAFAAILSAFDLVSLVILLIMLLILANTLSMSVRERTHEYGVLRAIGFSPRYVFGFILGEAVLIAIVGGLAGALLTLGLINGAMGPAIENSEMGVFFPYFRTPLPIVAISLAGAVVIGAIAGLAPAIGASRRKVTDALRRVD
jgi:putative ABC transport system permease protein